jgi:hypothetical protein
LSTSRTRTRAIALAATAGLAAAALAGCGSSSDPASTAAGDSTTPTITVKREAAITYDLPLVIKNNLPVDIRVAQQNASGPWNARPDGQWSTIADGESGTARLRPVVYWNRDDDSWSTLTPGPAFTLALQQRGTSQVTGLSMRLKYRQQTIVIIDDGPSTAAWGESWAFGTASGRACGPASPDGPAFSYTDPTTGTAATATITVDCPTRPLDGNPPTTLTVAPQ